MNPGADSSGLDFNSYLKRIGLAKEPPTLDYLKRIQKNHLVNIPFENLDIHYGGRIVLDINSIFDKIISSARGGYCFELNGLLYNLLKWLGYDCYLTSASFYEKDGTYSDPLDHMVIIATLGETDCLVDAGLTNGITHPKQLKEKEITLDYDRYYVIEKNIDDEYLLKRSKDQLHYETFYKFRKKELKLIQFLEINDRHQDHPDSYFVKNKIVSRLDAEGGRIVLSNKKLKLTTGGETQEIEILNEDEFLSKLDQYFGIKSPDLI